MYRLGISTVQTEFVKNYQFDDGVIKHTRTSLGIRTVSTDWVCEKLAIWWWSYETNKNFGKCESFHLRYFGSLELGILKYLFFISK